MPPPQRLHDRSPGCGADKVHGGPSTNQGVTSHASHLRRHPARRRPRDRWRRSSPRPRTRRVSAPPSRPPAAAAHRRRPGRRPRLRLRLRGWHPGFGFGFFGFLATLFFLFIVFALIRAIFWRGGPGRRGGWGPGGWGGYGRPRPRTAAPWETRGSQAFDEWHRRAHGDTPPRRSRPTPRRPTGTGLTAASSPSPRPRTSRSGAHPALRCDR